MARRWKDTRRLSPDVWKFRIVESLVHERWIDCSFAFATRDNNIVEGYKLGELIENGKGVINRNLKSISNLEKLLLMFKIISSNTSRNLSSINRRDEN